MLLHLDELNGIHDIDFIYLMPYFIFSLYMLLAMIINENDENNNEISKNIQKFSPISKDEYL